MTDIRRTLDEEFEARYGMKREHVPYALPPVPVPDDDLALYWLVLRRAKELDIGPPWFMDQLRESETHACDWLEEHGDPDDDDQPETIYDIEVESW